MPTENKHTQEKPKILLVLGTPGSGKTTIIDELIKKRTHEYATLDKDKLAAFIKVKQPSGLSRVVANIFKVDVDQDTIYQSFAAQILDDTSNPEKIRILLGNYAERFNKKIIDINLFLEKFDILIVRITCTLEKQWERVRARFESGIQVDKDKARAESFAQFSKDHYKLNKIEDDFIKSLEPYIHDGIQFCNIDNNSSSLKDIQTKVEQIEEFISTHHTPVFSSRSSSSSKQSFPSLDERDMHTLNLYSSTSETPRTVSFRAAPEESGIEPAAAPRGIIHNFLKYRRMNGSSSPMPTATTDNEVPIHTHIRKQGRDSYMSFS